MLHVAGQEHSLVEFVKLCRTFISPFGIAVVMPRRVGTKAVTSATIFIMPFRSPLRRKNYKQNATQSVVRAKRRSLRFEELETRRLMTATRFASTTTVKAVNTSWFDTNIHDNNLKTWPRPIFRTAC